jgi:carboxyl-terminal processing protease
MKHNPAVLIIIFLLFNSLAWCRESRQISLIESSNQIIACIENHFYKKSFLIKKFSDIKAEFRRKAETLSGEDEYKSAVRDMLKELNASHTSYYTSDDPEYYQLASVFGFTSDVRKLFNGKEILYPSIGIKTAAVNNCLFVDSVLEGSPAFKAGILRGDEIVDADGRAYHPVKSLKVKANHPLSLKIRRDEKGEVRKVSVTPEMINPNDEYLRAEKASVEIIQGKNGRIGYIHIWSYAGEQFHKAFLDEISDGRLKDADALVWDLRDGWGGAKPEYLNAFNREVPVLTSIDRDGKSYVYDPQWRKPVVMLINGGSRSGKEILAHGFRKFSIGPVVGEKTAGAVLGGSLFVQKDRSLLYLAGSDGQKKKAVEVLEKKLEGTKGALKVPDEIR